MGYETGEISNTFHKNALQYNEDKEIVKSEESTS